MNDPFAWWKAAIAGQHPPITTEVQCGFFVVKMNGTMVPASILYEGPKDNNGDPCGDEVMVCEIGGQQCDPEDNWLSLAKRPVSRSEYSLWLDKMMENV